MPETILIIRDLRIGFKTYAGLVKALDGVDLEVYTKETLGIVGETGCGKSITALSILGLLDASEAQIEGEILFEKKNLLYIQEKEMRKIRGRKIAIIFQDPMTYFNPVLTIGEQLSEAILEHLEYIQPPSKMSGEKQTRLSSRSETKRFGRMTGFLSGLMKDSNSSKVPNKIAREIAYKKACELLRAVKMPDPEKVFDRYPHELSGGMRQRVMISMALSCNPQLLIADEATTFLDVTTQRRILELMTEIKKERDLSLILITHNLGIVAEFCDRVAVMYAGTIVEYCDKMTLFDKPIHPYTRGLLRATPNVFKDVSKLEEIPGSIPDLINPPNGCRFHPRCKFAQDICMKEKPANVSIETNHIVSCHFAEKMWQNGEKRA